MNSDPLDDEYKSPLPAIIIGVILIIVGFAAWFALVPVTFLAGLDHQKNGSETHELLMISIVFYAALAGGGTTMIARRLSMRHWCSRITLGIFLIFLIVGITNYIWLGMLPNWLDTPIDMGPSPNR